MSEESMTEAENKVPVEATDAPVEVNVTPEPETAAPSSEAEEPVAQPQPQTKAEVIARLKTIVSEHDMVDRSEIESLKQAYYKLRNAEVMAAREAFVADGGNADDFMPPADPDEVNFKAQMGLIKERRAQALAEQEEEKKANLERKLAIIERIKEMSASPDVADKAYQEFKQLQAEWKEIRNVPAEQISELWKNYQYNVEQFYDQLRLNHEFRAYDFKKNLEIKTRLCEAAEKLAEVPKPAGICVYPSLVETVRSLLTEELSVSTVIGFPSSQTFTEVKIAETMLAVKAGATEIDMVMPVGKFLMGNYEEIYDEIQEIKAVCALINYVNIIFVPQLLMRWQHLAHGMTFSVCSKKRE